MGAKMRKMTWPGIIVLIVFYGNFSEAIIENITTEQVAAENIVLDKMSTTKEKFDHLTKVMTGMYVQFDRMYKSHVTQLDNTAEALNEYHNSEFYEKYKKNLGELELSEDDISADMKTVFRCIWEELRAIGSMEKLLNTEVMLYVQSLAEMYSYMLAKQIIPVANQEHTPEVLAVARLGHYLALFAYLLSQEVIIDENTKLKSDFLPNICIKESEEVNSFLKRVFADAKPANLNILKTMKKIIDKERVNELPAYVDTHLLDLYYIPITNFFDDPIELDFVGLIAKSFNVNLFRLAKDIWKIEQSNESSKIIRILDTLERQIAGEVGHEYTVPDANEKVVILTFPEVKSIYFTISPKSDAAETSSTNP